MREKKMVSQPPSGAAGLICKGTYHQFDRLERSMPNGSMSTDSCGIM